MDTESIYSTHGTNEAIVGYIFPQHYTLIHFTILLIGTTLTFAPMHLLGIIGHPRRQLDSIKVQWHIISTYGSILNVTSLLCHICGIV